VLLLRNHPHSNFKQLAKDKILNPNQWEAHLIEFKFCEDTRPDPRLQKAKAQHSMLMANLNRQGYREIKLHVILVGAMGTIYKDYTDKLWQTLIWITIIRL
jgi:hypothetical protein